MARWRHPGGNRGQQYDPRVCDGSRRHGGWRCHGGGLQQQPPGLHPRGARLPAGNHIIMSNLAQMAGHVTVEDHAILAGMSAIHQFCRIGRLAMVAACTPVRQDVAPSCSCPGIPP